MFSRGVFSKGLFRLALAALGALALAGCHRPTPVHPALWLVTGPGGGKAWLFGTIHALPDAVDWRSGKVTAALDGSDRLVVEVARLDQAPAIFASLSRSPGLPPLRSRVAPGLRPMLDRIMAEHHLVAPDFDGLETWAAALSLQQAVARDAGVAGENGVDRALVAAYPRRIEEFEGAAGQLGIFDRLAEADQRALLEGVLRDAAASQDRDGDVERAWAKGDLTPILAETARGFLADPELRAALLTDRNRDWSTRLAQMLRSGERPFVAVGAAHLAGPDGLPALLAAQGFEVRRIQ